MSAIEWITVEGFKSIRSIEKLALTSINVIIGSNGSGKSNFIAVFEFLNALREGRLKEYVGRTGGANNILHFGSKVTSKIYIRVAFNSEVNQYEIALSPTANDELVPTSEAVYYWDKRQYSNPYDRSLTVGGSEAAISSSSDNITQYVRKHLAGWRLYHFHDTSRTSPMKQTCDINDNRFLRPDGSNLAAFLYMLREIYKNQYEMIVSVVQRVAPFFQDFVLSPQVLNEEKIRLEWKHKGSDAYFSASSLSDGSLRFIALATLFLQPAMLRPSVILVDEPELGLHPYALTMLASLVRQASTQTQIIISTQSALLLDHFNPEEVLVADRNENGTEFRRLVAQELEAWLDEYGLGQLWEKAEFGGRPGSIQ
jgi:predicted ATPase